MALTPRRTIAVLAALALLATAGCSKDDAAPPTKSPQQALAVAQQKLEATSGVHITLRAKDLPAAVAGLAEASGVATDAPAFKGTMVVVVNGATVQVPLVSVAGTVHAQLPLTTGWAKVDPAVYGAPDPAAFLDPAAGFSSLLPLTTGAARKGEVRGGVDNTEVLTEYSGTVPAAAVQKVIPSASGETFAAVYALTTSDELRTAAFTGVFYSGSPAMTYTVDFTGYGATEQISAP